VAEIASGLGRDIINVERWDMHPIIVGQLLEVRPVKVLMLTVTRTIFLESITKLDAIHYIQENQGNKPWATVRKLSDTACVVNGAQIIAPVILQKQM